MATDPNAMVKCPNCNGHGNMQGFRMGQDMRCSYGITRCSVCKGTKEITAEREHRIRLGEALRSDRVSRHLGQREEAERLGITPKELADIEMGRALPVRGQGVCPICKDPECSAWKVS